MDVASMMRYFSDMSACCSKRVMLARATPDISATAFLVRPFSTLRFLKSSAILRATS